MMQSLIIDGIIADAWLLSYPCPDAWLLSYPCLCLHRTVESVKPRGIGVILPINIGVDISFCTNSKALTRSTTSFFQDERRAPESKFYIELCNFSAFWEIIPWDLWRAIFGEFEVQSTQFSPTNSLQSEVL